MDFEYFLEEVLMPTMNPFPGTNSVLIMDNARIHHNGRIMDICDNHQVLLIYLPPDSPDFNPIKKVFSVLKSHLRRDLILTGDKMEDVDLIKLYINELVTPRLMAVEFRSCGYM